MADTTDHRFPLKAANIPRSYQAKWTPSIIAKALLRFLFVFANNVYGISTYMVWAFLLRPLLWHKKLRVHYWKLEGYLFHFLLTQVGSWLWTAGYRVLNVGDDVLQCVRERCLVLSNHQSTGDVPLLMYDLQNKYCTSDNVMWIMDAMFKYSNFGIVSQVHGDFFIQQGKATRDLQTQRLRRHLADVYQPRDMGWLYLFPEGGFLRKRREASQKFAIKNGHPVLEHVTLPRIGAMKCCIDTLTHQNGVTNGNRQPRPLKWLVDVTIGYPEGKPLDMFCITFGHRPPCDTYIHYRLYPMDSVPRDDDAMLAWMYKRYEEKELLLDHFYATGRFPERSEAPELYGETSVRQRARQLWLGKRWLLSLHFFGLLTFYLLVMGVSWCFSLTTGTLCWLWHLFL